MSMHHLPLAKIPVDACWEFVRKHPNAPQIEPIAGELFTGEALEAPANSLVREAIQNSLDARAGEEPVRVRFTLPERPVAGSFESPWLARLKPHLSAERNGLTARLSDGEQLSTLLIEDYGTCGLTGDVSQTNDVADEWRGRRNHFFFFWRAIGRSGKESGERGSWGLGKSVLPASSRINTFFGVSCQQPDAGLRLLGLSVLRHHNLSSEARGQEPFSPYGYFGQRSGAGVAMPIEAPGDVADFCREFGVTREGKNGLSLVVLLPQFGFTQFTLITAAIVQYFFPIIEGHLVVEVAAGAHVTVINASTIAECARLIEPYLDEHRIVPAALHETLALARWSVEQRRGSAVRLNPAPKSSQPRWVDEVFDVPGWDGALARFSAGEAAEFVVPVTVTPKAEPDKNAEFFVCLKKVPADQQAKAFYLRDGITISGIKAPVARGLAAFVTAESGPLAEFLRQSENPAHTEWHEKGGRLTAGYEKPALLLRYVKDSVAAIYDRLTRPAEGIDADLLADLFFLEEDPSPDDPNPVSSEGGRGRAAQKMRIPVLSAPPEPVRISACSDGILFSGVPENAVEGQVIRMRIAYDVRRGNPFERWSPNDFDLSELKRQIEWDGAMSLRIEGCTLEFAIERPDFTVLVRGFDPDRDMRVESRVISDAP